MNYFQWTIGSTTVRNPDRLRDGLKILHEYFKGKKWDVSKQESFFELLKKNNIYEMGDEKYEQMTSKRKQEHARKWISILNQLGFCYAYHSSDKPVIITEAGQALLDNPDIEDEIFLRQLLKYQKPCVLPKQNGASFENVSVLPFVVSLKITYELGGLSKDEISMFLNTTVRMEDINKTIKQIIDYRNQKGKIVGRVKKRELYYKTQLARLEEVFKNEINERVALIKNLVVNSKKDKNFILSTEGEQLLDSITRGGKGSNTIKAQRAQRNIIKAIKSGKGVIVVKRIFLEYYLP